MCKYKGPRMAKTMSKENYVGGLTLVDFKVYYKATVIKIVLVCSTGMKIDTLDQWFKIKSPDINSDIYGHINSYI